MDTLQLISNCVTILACSLEAYGAYKTIKLKTEPPILIPKSTLLSDIRAERMATLGSDNMSENEVFYKIQEESNRIIYTYNDSVFKMLEDNKEKDAKSAHYFKFIFAGFIIQVSYAVCYIFHTW